MRICGDKGFFQSRRLSLLVWYFAIFRYAMFLRSSQCNSMLLVDRILMEPKAAGWTSENWQISSRSAAWRRLCLVLPSGAAWNSGFRSVLSSASVLHREILRKAEIIPCFFKMLIKQSMKSTESLQVSNFLPTSSSVWSISFPKKLTLILSSFHFPGRFNIKLSFLPFANMLSDICSWILNLINKHHWNWQNMDEKEMQ